MKNYYRPLFFLILISQIVGGFLYANDKESVVKFLSSNNEKDIERGLTLAQHIDTLKVNEKLVILLDSNIKSFSDGDNIKLHPWQAALFILSRRFPEYANDTKDRSLTVEKSTSFKQWWGLNKHNIIYHDNNTHSYSKLIKEVQVQEDPSKALAIIAEKIKALGDSYPQLKEFSLESHLNKKEMKIEYEFHTHKAQGSGGWTSAVPNPDPDGIWFYIDFHDASSTAQIHTQPAEITSYYLGDKKLQFLTLEGNRTKSVSDELWKIFKSVGVTERPFNR